MKLSGFIIASIIVPVLAWGVDTTIKGGRMELLDKGNKVHFTDNVRLERGSDVLQSREMITNKGRDKVTAKGNVQLLRVVSENEQYRGTGASGFYDTQTGEGYLIGQNPKAHMIYTEVLSATATRHLDVYAERFDFYKTKSDVSADREVYGKTIDPETQNIYEFWSDQAFYNGQSKKVDLTGTVQPIVKEQGEKGRKDVRGDRITYFLDSRRFISEGNAQAVFIDEEEKHP